MTSVLSAGARQAARLRANSSTRSRTSLSTAAGLVVKPSTPPVMSGRRQGTALAGSPILQAKPHAMNSLASKEPVNLPSSSTTAAEAKAEELRTADIPSQTLVEEVPSQVLIEVRSLGGESVLRAEFSLTDRALSVKERLRAVRKIPLWQQMLTFQGEVVDDHSKLQDLNLPSEGAAFELLVRAGPSDEDIAAFSAAKELLTEGEKALDSVTKRDIREVRCFCTPPPACLDVCLVALHLLAGSWDAIPVKRNGNPKNSNWDGCKDMLGNAGFISQLLSLPALIDNGRLSKERMDVVRRQIQGIFPESQSDAERIACMGRCSLLCQKVMQHLISVRNYYDNATEFSERFGGATITKLLSKSRACQA